MGIVEALLAWQTWAVAAMLCGLAAYLVLRSRRAAERAPVYSADARGVTMRAHRTTREVTWSEVREVRREGARIILYGAGEREVAMPLSEARRLGVLDRLGEPQEMRDE